MNCVNPDLETTTKEPVLSPWQAAAYSSEDGTLTPRMIDARVEDALRAHRKKAVWQADVHGQGQGQGKGQGTGTGTGTGTSTGKGAVISTA